MAQKLEDLTTDQLGDYYSDFSKSVYGFRARDINFNDRAGLILGIRRLHATVDRTCETVAGRNELRDQGWIINEPATAEQDGWVDYIERQRREAAAAERAAEEAKGDEMAAALAYDTRYDHLDPSLAATMRKAGLSRKQAGAMGSLIGGLCQLYQRSVPHHAK